MGFSVCPFRRESPCLVCHLPTSACRAGRTGADCFLQTGLPRVTGATEPSQREATQSGHPPWRPDLWRPRSSFYVAASRRRSSRKSFDIACRLLTRSWWAGQPDRD